MIFLNSSAQPKKLAIGLFLVISLSLYWLSTLSVIRTQDTYLFSKNIVNNGTSLQFDVYFYKQRGCTFNPDKSLVWYGSNHKRHKVIFHKKSDHFPKSRETGPQYGSSWIIEDLVDIKGSYAYVYHTCWGIEKVSKFYDDYISTGNNIPPELKALYDPE